MKPLAKKIMERFENKKVNEDLHPSLNGSVKALMNKFAELVNKYNDAAQSGSFGENELHNLIEYSKGYVKALEHAKETSGRRNNGENI